MLTLTFIFLFHNNNKLKKINVQRHTIHTFTEHNIIIIIYFLYYIISYYYRAQIQSPNDGILKRKKSRGFRMFLIHTVGR